MLSEIFLLLRILIERVSDFFTQTLRSTDSISLPSSRHGFARNDGRQRISVAHTPPYSLELSEGAVDYDGAGRKHSALVRVRNVVVEQFMFCALPDSRMS